MNFNKAVIVGRLTRDPESRALPSGQSVTSFSIATNRIWQDQGGNKQEATEYHNVAAFGKLAEICSRYLTKGRLVLVEGRIQTRSWQDQDGNKRYRTEIIADNMQMGPRTETAGSQSESSPEQNSEQMRKTDLSQEEIPVIEAEEPIKQEQENQENAEDQKEPEKKEGVNVNDIPF
jgi:single-strand DNA-binding protein